ncbi:hypothetical protein H4582DRAFT_955078 [Lactarius indigo]|nr:hypothetical protein H4582DRAFT_955078 [Lactarius indigo]
MPHKQLAKVVYRRLQPLLLLCYQSGTNGTRVGGQHVRPTDEQNKYSRSSGLITVALTGQFSASAEHNCQWPGAVAPVFHKTQNDRTLASTADRSGSNQSWGGWVENLNSVEHGRLVSP